MKWLASLCASRDVLVRALTLQLLSGLARSARGVAVLVQHEPDLFQLVLRSVSIYGFVAKGVHFVDSGEWIEVNLASAELKLKGLPSLKFH